MSAGALVLKRFTLYEKNEQNAQNIYKWREKQQNTRKNEVDG